MWTAAAVVPLTTAALLAVWPQPTSACGACICANEVSVFPAGGTLPTNGSLLLFGAPGAVTLEDATADAGIPFDLTAVKEGVWSLAPTEPLTAGTPLRLRTGPYEHTYVVGDGADHTAPALPELTVTEVPGGMCGSGFGAAFSAGTASEEPLLYQLTVQGDESVEDVWVPHGALGVELVAFGATNSGCLGPGELDSDDRSVRVVARAVDAAGNASPATMPISVSMNPITAAKCPDAGPLGCATAPGVPVALAGVLLLGRLRRRNILRAPR